MSTTIKKCTCKSKFQDKRYGKGKRVYNETTDTKTITARCTVCGREI